MEIFSSISTLLGSSWASGVNLYLTLAGLGIAQRAEWISLPGQMEVLSHPLIIVVAILLYIIEFFADKIPYVDSVWDSVHTVIRPLGGASIGFLAVSEFGPVAQTAVALVTGGVAADSHLTKATARAAINTSPEPVSNSIASLTEDFFVAGMLFLIMQHPIIASIFVVLFILFSFWFLKKMYRFLKKVFKPSSQKPQPEYY